MSLTKAIIVWFVVFISLYLGLSTFFLLFTSDYIHIITNVQWISLYSYFLGWWIALVVASEYHEKLISNLNKKR